MLKQETAKYKFDQKKTAKNNNIAKYKNNKTAKYKK